MTFGVVWKKGVSGIVPNAKRWTVGDHVIAGKRGEGTIRFIGELIRVSGIWYGIELDGRRGKNDGTLKNVRYFECDDGYGLFIKSHELTDSTRALMDAEANSNDTDKTDRSLYPSVSDSSSVNSSVQFSESMSCVFLCLFFRVLVNELSTV